MKDAPTPTLPQRVLQLYIACGIDGVTNSSNSKDICDVISSLWVIYSWQHVHRKEYTLINKGGTTLRYVPFCDTHDAVGEIPYLEGSNCCE